MKLLHHTATCVKWLLRPFTVMWPMTVAVTALYAAAVAVLHMPAAMMRGAFPELYVLALLLSLFPGKWRTALGTVVMTILALLTTIEAFLYDQFRLTLRDEVFQLMLESNPSETSQFFSSFVMRSVSLKFAAVALAFAVTAGAFHRMRSARALQRWSGGMSHITRHILQGSALTVTAMAFVLSGWLQQQPRLLNVMLSNNTNDFELRFIDGESRGGCGSITSLSRLALGAKLYVLTTHQCQEIMATARDAAIDGSSHTSPGIMLLIGESFIKRHAQLYGYPLATTPRMMAEAHSGNLTVIKDATTIAIQTSQVLKNMLSMHSSDQPGSWTSLPMLPQLMKLAGYRVSLITNQYALNNHNIWNSTGGFFLRDPDVAHLLLDYQTDSAYRYDEGLLGELDKAIPATAPYNMAIFHVRGQHVAFENGYPPTRAHFKVSDYSYRTRLNDEQRRQVAHYDNATLYQDSICGVLFDRYADKDMVIVMVSDHGENVYDDNLTLGRVHDAMTPQVRSSQYEVPMWIWCSPRYRQLHPDMVAAIQAAATRRFITDDIPHMLLRLAGIACKYYDPKRDLLSPNFAPRPVEK